MPVSIDHSLEKSFNISTKSVDLSIEVDSVYLIVGTADFIKSEYSRLSHRTDDYKAILVTQPHQLAEDLKTLEGISPFQIISDQHAVEFKKALEQFEKAAVKQSSIEKAKIEFANKRRKLEELTEELNSQSAKKVQSLEESHNEEARKNANEKSLLHFLDFVQSDSKNEDFLPLLIKFLWRDMKKMTHFVQVGFCFQNYSSKSHILSYNGVNEVNYSAEIDFAQNKIAASFALAMGRPVGKIYAWSLTETKKPVHFFAEVLSGLESSQEIEGYVRERLAIMSLYLDQWMIEKEYESLVDRWDRTFRSFSGFVHVIDDQYNLYQANYIPQDQFQSGQKCYQVLAGRAQPCPDCPIHPKSSKSFVLKENVHVQTNVSAFDLDGKKYFFVIYDDVTQTHHLNSQVIQSEKMSSLGRLGNHLAHELNNPLTGIKSYVEMLLSDQQAQMPNNMRSDLTEILKATVRSQNIIRNFLQFSHSSKRQIENVNLLELVQNTLQLLKSATRPHRLFIDIKPHLSVWAYSQDLQQVIFNLIKNSCQAMTDAGTIKVFTTEKSDRVELLIEDTGMGFDIRQAQQAFEPFFTTKKKGEGTGLGLYLSKKLIQNMKGDLSIDSPTGSQGARMKITLPLGTTNG